MTLMAMHIKVSEVNFASLVVRGLPKAMIGQATIGIMYKEKIMTKFTTIEPNKNYRFVERQQENLGMTDKERAKKREQIKNKNKKRGV